MARIPFEEMMDGAVWIIDEEDMDDAWIKAISVVDREAPLIPGDPDRWEEPDRNVVYDVHDVREGQFWSLEGGWVVAAHMLNGFAQALGGSGKSVTHVDASDLKTPSDDRLRGYTFQFLSEDVTYETL